MDETLQIQSTRLPDGLIEAKLGNLTVRVRESDGWVDATHLSQSAGKLLGHWSRLQSESHFPCYPLMDSSQIVANFPIVQVLLKPLSSFVVKSEAK